MVTALLVAAIALYLGLATLIFRQDKQELVFDLNKSVVTTLATEVDSTLHGVSDKLRLYALLFGPDSTIRDQAALKEVISNDAVLVRLELFEQQAGGTMKSISQVTDSTFLSTYSLT